MSRSTPRAPLFKDRANAGRRLAARLAPRLLGNVRVLAIPPGGVLVADPIRRVLDAPIDLLPVERVRGPDHVSATIAAVTADGTVQRDEERIRRSSLAEDALETLVDRARERARAQATRYGARGLDVTGQVVVLVDEGIVSGLTMKAAVQAVNEATAARVVVAAPVATRDVAEELTALVDEVVLLETVTEIENLDQVYAQLDPVSEDEVRALVARQEAARPPFEIEGCGQTPVRVQVDATQLDAVLRVPKGATALAVFAGGSRGTLGDPRDRIIAEHLADRGIGSLRVDLLTASERQRDEGDGRHRPDLDLLARRTRGCIDWLARGPSTSPLPVALVGSSTGAAAALMVAAMEPERVQAVVSRGGRVDLAKSVFEAVTVPVLLVVGGEDEAMLEANREALDRLENARLHVVEGADHLFHEPGTLAQAAQTTAAWLEETMPETA